MDRNQQLLEKMQEINDNFNAKTNKYYSASTDNLENKVEMLKKKVQLAICKNKEELTSILKESTDLYDKVEKSNKHYEAQANLQMERLRDFEDKITKKIQLEILQRKERENSIITEFEDKAQYLKKQIEKQRKIRENLFGQMTATLENDLPSIMAELNEAKASFQEEQEEATVQCRELLAETENYLKQFAAEQEANSTKAFQLIRGLTKKIKTEIEQEKAACEATHEEVFAYVEQACNNLVEEL